MLNTIKILLLLPLLCSCATTAHKVKGDVNLAEVSENNEMTIMLSVQEGVKQLWDENRGVPNSSLFTVYVQNAERKDTAATHQIRMCSESKACVMTFSGDSIGLYDNEVTRFDIEKTSSGAEFNVPLNSLPNSFYLWRAYTYSGVSTITTADGQVIPKSYRDGVYLYK